MKKFQIYNKGFTIIETLVAIAILMISIAGPLTIAQKSLLSALYARDQVTASFLAQDAIETLKNKRDSNLYASQNWLAGMNGLSASPSCFAAGDSGNECKVETVGTTPTISSCSTFSGTCSLYQDGAGFKTTGTIKSPFSRSFYFKKTNAGQATRACNTSDQKCTLVMNVRWKTGKVQNIVTIENEFFNVYR